jgi:hypothetical protein
MTITFHKIKTILVSLFLIGASALIANPALAASGNTQGVAFTWPDLVFAPQSIAEQSTYAFDLNYSNNSGRDFYYVGYSLSTAENRPVTGDFAFGVKNGNSGKFRISFSYLNFLNFTGPSNYSFNLCTLVALGEKETCTKGTLVIKKKDSTDLSPVVPANPSGVSTAANAASLTVQGVTVSWPEKIYVPDRTNFPLLIAFSNKSGRDILEAQWILKDSAGQTIAERSLIGFENGADGYELTNVIKESFKSGPGIYRVIVRVEGYGGTGTFQDEKQIQVLPWSQNQAQPFSRSLLTSSNSLNLNGFAFKWPANISVPSSGNVGVELEFINQTGKDVLSAELMLVDYKGSRVFERSVIGLKSGATSIQEANTISESFPLGAGIYKIVATTQNYKGSSGSLGVSYIEVKAAPGPPKAIEDLSATRSSGSIVYTFSKPSSYSPITSYSVIIQALLAPGIDPASYSSYGQMTAIKYAYTESFSLTAAEIKNFLVGKVPDPSNTSVMVRVQANSSNGSSYLSNGIYSQTSGFISNTPAATSKTIYCKKGTSTKSVSGKSPKCPSGYKKVA